MLVNIELAKFINIKNFLVVELPMALRGLTIRQLTLQPRWKINSFLSEISVCWRCTEKITIQIEFIERAFSVILRASLATRRSSQPSPQHPSVAAENLRFNTPLATANARWRLPSHTTVDCIAPSGIFLPGTELLQSPFRTEFSMGSR